MRIFSPSKIFILVELLSVLNHGRTSRLSANDGIAVHMHIDSAALRPPCMLYDAQPITFNGPSISIANQLSINNLNLDQTLIYSIFHLLL